MEDLELLYNEKMLNGNHFSMIENPTCPYHKNNQVLCNWVDLGLPSGLNWASCNLGVTTQNNFGSFYAWAEIKPKYHFIWRTYRYCSMNANNELSSLTKYNTDEKFGPIDNKTRLESSDDVASLVFGNGARIPTKHDWIELINNTAGIWTRQNGINGWQLTSHHNHQSIFLPAAGTREGANILHLGECGYYWSSSLGMTTPFRAWYFYFDSNHSCVSRYGRNHGFSIRAVRNS